MSVRRFVRAPGVIEVVTFGPDHPGAESRAFYERLGPGGSRDELGQEVPRLQR